MQEPWEKALWALSVNPYLFSVYSVPDGVLAAELSKRIPALKKFSSVGVGDGVTQETPQQLNKYNNF